MNNVFKKNMISLSLSLPNIVVIDKRNFDKQKMLLI